MGLYKYNVQRGKSKLDGVTVAAGAAEAQTDTISVNIDEVKQDIHAGKWPPL
jgi:hypothetical protein